MKRIACLIFSFLLMLLCFTSCDKQQKNEENDIQNTENNISTDANQDSGIESDAHQHSFVETKIDATCEEQGYTLYQCDCGYSYKDNYIDAFGHDNDFIGLAVDETEIDFAATYICKTCHKTNVGTLDVSKIGIPVISLTGSLDGISKENKITIDAEYISENINFNSKATLKIQGASSSGYPKKNYNIQFLDDNGAKQKVKLVDSWGKQSKYCLKANYIDYSQSRNVVSGKLFGDVVRSRNIEDEFDSLTNGGAVDGYPVLMYLNGGYLGLYTLNIPKDEWMFDMDGSTETQAILFANTWNNVVYLKEHVNEDLTNGLELEYCSTDDYGWVVESFNNFVDFLNNSNDEYFLQHISDYTNVERVIDVLIYTTVICGGDNTAKNILWTTYDGVKWTPSVYDMDGTWGLIWHGSDYYSPTSMSFITGTVLFSRLWNLKNAEIINRYRELREDILSISNIEKRFSEFFDSIPDFCYVAEKAKWTGVPSHETNNYNQIIAFAKEHLAYLDSVAEITIAENADVAYKVGFKTDKHAKAFYYQTNDYSVSPVRVNGWCWSRNSATGELTMIDGQVNFKVILDDGYEIDNIEIDDSTRYKNLKNPSDTLNENTYRITKITGDIVVTIKTKKVDDISVVEPEGYNITFVNEHCKIVVYNSQDYTVQGVESSVALSRDSSTGEPTKDGGQCNFKVICDDGYKVLGIVIDGTYKNLKGEEDTLVENVFRITKIASDLTVTVNVVDNE